MTDTADPEAEAAAVDPPESGLCEEWPVAWACDVTGKDPADLERARRFAARLLWGMAGGRVGVCTYTEGYYPACTAECGVPYKTPDGLWHNGGRGGECCRLLLHHRPVRSIVEVWEFGVLVPAEGYTTDGTYLRRRGQCWPCGIDCDDPPIVTTYTAGASLPDGTDAAVGEVGCELLKAWGGGECRLPSRLTAITRQGVTATFAAPDEFIKAGRLGLPITDAWLTTVNPNALRAPSRVYSPDLPRRGW